MADDDDDDCTLAREAFEESAIEGSFDCVEDGMELMDYLIRAGNHGEGAKSRAPSLILLDLNMPKKDGRETLREIKAIPVLQDIPVVILTTSRDEKDVAFSLAHGARSFITKPATFAEWVEMMRSLLAPPGNG
jgi:CheY-like chemotaxis protein